TDQRQAVLGLGTGTGYRADRILEPDLPRLLAGGRVPGVHVVVFAAGEDDRVGAAAGGHAGDLADVTLEHQLRVNRLGRLDQDGLPRADAVPFLLGHHALDAEAFPAEDLQHRLQGLDGVTTVFVDELDGARNRGVDLVLGEDGLRLDQFLLRLGD